MVDFTYSMEKDSLVPLYHQLKALILREIHDGNWQADNLIPTELEIMDLFGLSRTTVRQALTDLVKESVLYRKKGIGTFVAKPKIDLQYLGNVVSFNAQIQNAGLTPQTKVLEQAIITPKNDVLEAMELSGGSKVIKLVRLRYVDEDPLAVVTSYLPHASCGFIMEYDLEKESLYQTLALREETRVVKVTRLIEAQAADEQDCKLMKLRKGFPVQNFINKAYNQTGVIMEYCIAHYRGDRNKFYVEIDVE